MCNYKYLNIYIRLVDSRLYRGIKREKGFEVHHIVPKSWGGCNNNFNKVKLTYREHYIAHKLLHKAYPEDKHMAYALLCMLRENVTRKLTSRQIEEIKKYWSKYRSKPRPDSHMKTKKHRERQSKAIQGDNNPLVKFPEKNHTAKPVRVYYSDGRVVDYAYMKEITVKENIPYGTLKWLTKHNIGSKKHAIDKMEKLC